MNVVKSRKQRVESLASRGRDTVSRALSVSVIQGGVKHGQMLFVPSPSVPSSSAPLRGTTAGMLIVPLVPLARSLRAWLALPNLSCWLISTIRLSYAIQFARRLTKLSWNTVAVRDALVLCEEIAVLLAKDAIELVHPAEMRQGFIAPNITIPDLRYRENQALEARALEGTLEILALEGAAEEPALEGAAEELALEGALEAQAQHGAFEGLALERALGWSQRRLAGLSQRLAACLGERRPAACLREPRMAGLLFPRMAGWSKSQTAAGWLWLGQNSLQTPEDPFPPS